MEILIVLVPFVGATAAVAVRAPAAIRWLKRRRARLESAERVERRLALKEEIERRLPPKNEYLNRGDAIIRDVHRVDKYPEVDDNQNGVGHLSPFGVKA